MLYYETFWGHWEQKESAELASATSSASKDGAILQTLVPSTQGTCSWRWGSCWQAAVTLAEHSIGAGSDAHAGKIVGIVASSTDIHTFALKQPLAVINNRLGTLGGY